MNEIDVRLLKYTTSLLKKIEAVYEELGYVIRYERGTFQSGYCVLETKKVVVINKFFEQEARISSLIDILHRLEFDSEALSEASQKTLQKLAQKSLDL